MLRRMIFSRLSVTLVLVATVNLSLSAHAEPPRERAPLGLNLAGVTDWSSELVFEDAFAAARPWISQAQGKPWGQGWPLDVDEKGNVRSLREGQYAESIVFMDFAGRFPGGKYVCRYEGEGELDFAFDARHPGMKALYLQDLQNWYNAGGEVFCVFSSMGRYSKWGSWGLVEYAWQELESAPKYQAVVEYLGSGRVK